MSERERDRERERERARERERERERRGSSEIGRPRSRGWINFGRSSTRGVGRLEN